MRDMQFTNLTFLFVFMPMLLATYYVVKQEYRKYVLLVFSLLFYTCGASFFLVPLVTLISINYVIASLIVLLKRGEDERKKSVIKALFALGVCIDLSILVYYKNADTIAKIIHLPNNVGSTEANLLIPLGISYFTFKAISYLADVYVGKIKNVSFSDMGTYLTYFAQIQSGPISRFGTFQSSYSFNKQLFGEGAMLFMMGFSKKVILADSLCNIVNEVFDSPEVLQSTSLAWVGAVCYSLQLFCDFSGYSDMAIGIGNMLGIECEKNFDYPYATKTVSGFWRRWHISLGSWFRDYVYIPLGGSRVKPWRMYFNLFIVWMLTGIWHGSGLRFIAWGLGYFVVISFEKKTKLYEKLKSPVMRVLYRICSLLFINFQWVIFRSGSLTNGLKHIKTMVMYTYSYAYSRRAWFLLKDYWFFVILAVLFATPFYKVMRERMSAREEYSKTFGTVSGIVIVLSFVFAISFIISGQNNPFVYGNF